MILVTSDKKILTNFAGEILTNSAGEILTGDRCPYRWYRLTVSFDTGDINPNYVPGSSEVWQFGAASGFSLDSGEIIYYQGDAVWEYGYWGSYPTALDVRAAWISPDGTTEPPGRYSHSSSVTFCVSEDAGDVNPGLVYRSLVGYDDVASDSIPAALSAIYPDFYATYNLFEIVIL